MAGMFDDLIPGKASDKPADFGMFADLVPAQSNDGDFVRGAKVALGQTIPIAKGVVGLVGATAEKAFGDGGIATGVKNWGLKGYTEGMEKLQPMQRDTDELTTAWDKAKQGDLGALVDWAQYGLGYAVGQGGEALAASVLGGMAGAAMAPGLAPVTGAAGAVTGLIAKGATKEAAESLIKKAVLKEANALISASAAAGGERMAADVAVKQATKNIASNIGSTSTMVGYGMGQELGSIYPETEKHAAEEGRSLTGSDIARVWGAGIVAGGLEGLTDKLGVDAALGKIKMPGVGSRLANGVKMGAAGVAVEGSTEAVQTAIERIGSGQSLTDAEAQKDYINSAGLGAIGGGAIGGGVGLMHFKRQQAADQGLADLSSAQDAESAVDAFTRATDVPLTVPGAERDASQAAAADRFLNPDAAQQAPEPSAEFIETAPFGDRVLTLREQLADPATRDAVRTRFGPDGLNQAMYSASVADNMSVNIPDKTRGRMLDLAERIVGESILTPISRPGVGSSESALAVGVDQTPDVPRIGLDTRPTGTIRVDQQGNAAPETRADAISANQPINRPARPDGMTQQVTGRPLPRDGVMVGEGTLTTPERKTAPQIPTRLLTAGTTNSGDVDAGNAGGPGGAPTADPGRSDRVAGVPDGRPADVLASTGSPAGQGVAGPGTAGDGARPATLTPGQRVTLPGKDGTPEVWTVEGQTGTILRLDNGKGRMRAVQVGSKAWDAIQLEGGAATEQTTPINSVLSEAAGVGPAATSQPTPQADAQPTATPERVEAPAPAAAATEPAAAAAGPADLEAGRLKLAPVDAFYESLIGKKNTKQVTSSGGRTIFDVEVTPAMRAKHHVNGRFPETAGFELKPKADVTGVPQDRGYVLIDKREQARQRAANAVQQAPEATTNTPPPAPTGNADKPGPAKPEAAPAIDQPQAQDAPAAPQGGVTSLPTPAATHKDPGEPAEPVTPAVVSDAIKTGVQATDRKPSAMKAELLAEVDQAVRDAPDYTEYQGAIKALGPKDAQSSYTSGGRTALGNTTAPEGDSRPTRTFRIEDDGVFTVNNTVRQLLTFRAKVESSPGFRDRQAPASLTERATDALDRRSADSAIAGMVDEGDFQAALDYAEAKGVDISNVKLSKMLRDRLDKWESDQASAKRMAEYEAAGKEAVQSTPASNAAAQKTQPAPDGETAGPTEAAAPDPFTTPEAFDGKTITQQVQVADTGKTATLRMDAGQALRDVNEREAALLKLKACVGR